MPSGARVPTMCDMKNIIIASLVAASTMAAPSIARAEGFTFETPKVMDGLNARSSFKLASLLAGIGLAGVGASVPIALSAKGGEPGTFLAVASGSIGSLFLIASVPAWVHGARAYKAEKAARALAVTPTRGGATVSVTLTF